MSLPLLGGEPTTLEFLRDALAQYEGIQTWAPPPRFAGKTFANYRIDHHVNGQAAAVADVEQFTAKCRRGVTAMFRRKGPKGCYLDGDFGVGKTHLLAAAWHAAPATKSYVSFAEAINLCIRHGPPDAVKRLAADLVCIDEFELDDPSNTRMADLLCDGLVQRGCRLLVTSNTVPGELGVGRLFVDQFRAQLVRISAIFTDVHVPGADYRQREDHGDDLGRLRWDVATVGQVETAAPDQPSTTAARSLSISAKALDQLLLMVPVVHLRGLGGLISHLHISQLDTFSDQLAALRFVHLIDRAYDQCITLSVAAQCAMNDLFHADYRDWAFAKKYRRCLSRLSEACREEIRHALPH